ncbi:hypothetical protein SORBI_3001G140950 [Sorghum bicolor]|uniref:Uncharacterized protein n=1 Tax=Sorghum bicolor TaxID=4558 RepID=A0A1Z5S5K9_SORBI|nr:hypothetical protein SORBI_3001G140950 [Sorghum bicolor]
MVGYLCLLRLLPSQPATFASSSRRMRLDLDVRGILQLTVCLCNLAPTASRGVTAATSVSIATSRVLLLACPSLWLSAYFRRLYGSYLAFGGPRTTQPTKNSHAHWANPTWKVARQTVSACMGRRPGMNAQGGSVLSCYALSDHAWYGLCRVVLCGAARLLILTLSIQIKYKVK